MKIYKILLVKTALFVQLMLVGATVFAQQTGLENGKLLPCESRLNCMVTENFIGVERRLSPILFKEIDSRHDSPIIAAEYAIEKMGGEIVSQTPTYIHATFKTFVFRFIDDFEVRLDDQNRLMQLRSASRVGAYDFGKNKRRINEFSMLLTGAKEQ